MKVVVLCGGTSSEREVSLRSGAAVAAWVREAGHEVELVDCPESEVALRDFGKTDLIFPVFHGGSGEDGSVQAVCELRGLRYTGCSPAASAVCMHKVLAKELMAFHHVPTPRWISASSRDGDVSDLLTLKMAEETMEFPLVVKPNRSGSSVGITVVQDKEGWAAAITDALKEDHLVLVEEFIHGRELTVAVVAGEVLPPIEIKPKTGFYDYKNKYTKGASTYTCPAPVTGAVAQVIQEHTLTLWKALGLSGFVRMDYRLGPGQKLYCLEVNTIPGMTELSLVPMAARAAGWSNPEMVQRIIDDSAKR